ncbi:MAG: hypothetical protein CVV05_00080 [Gammaproteobacteria bacterium HGW-Gammaproteobacteria-1]|nr:MAG: hypothetical protein CVV05_00080 [Gammaproteobacteria bacterium HGW-Gammaproteobacteria-1]
METEVRYFLFQYRWIGVGRDGQGNLWVEHDGFPSNESLKAKARERLAEPGDIVITGWNEFGNEADYRAFIGAPAAATTD